MRKVLTITGVVLAVLVAVGGGLYFKMAGDARKALAALPYEEVDMSRVADGIYKGEADAGLVFVRVEVEVRDHAIGDVRILEHRKGMGAKAEAIAADMIAQNRYDVDAVSGATLSSEAIKSAVSAALKKGES